MVGNRIDNTPKVTLSAAGEYHFLSRLPGLSLTAGVYYVGSRAINPLNQGYVPGYATVDLGASYETDIRGHPTTFRINAENIADTRYWAATGSLYLAEGAPQTVKFSVSTRF